MEQYIERMKMMNEICSIIKQDEVKEARKCECGYDPFDKHSFFKAYTFKCDVKKALQNHITFPSYALLSSANTTSPLYHNMNNYITKPRRHWAIIFQIDKNISDENQEAIIGSTYYGENFPTYFHHDRSENPITFTWPNLKVCNTLVILYAQKKSFADDLNGIEVEKLDNCFIFRAKLGVLFEEASKLLKDADMKSKSEIVECFGCGVKTEMLYRCSCCSLAKYCSKGCQLKEWNKSHKKLCKQSQILLRLASLPRHKFKHYYSFNLENPEKGLPSYTYIKKYDVAV